MATPHRDASTIEGQAKDALLNGDNENYNGENGYTTHTITRDRSKGITVELNQPYIINCISMLLWDKDNRCVCVGGGGRGDGRGEGGGMGEGREGGWERGGREWGGRERGGRGEGWGEGGGKDGREGG